MLCFRHAPGKWGDHMAEKRMQVFQVVPGAKLLEDMYYNNELIISKGTILNETMISRLKKYGIYGKNRSIKHLIFRFCDTKIDKKVLKSRFF